MSAAAQEVHVFAEPERGRWAVKQGRRTLSRHRTQSQAVRAAMREAMRDQVDLVTHAVDGRIRSKDSYGDESPRRDTEH